LFVVCLFFCTAICYRSKSSTFRRNQSVRERKKEKFKKPKIQKPKSASQKVPTSPNNSNQQKMKSKPSSEMNNNLQDVNMETFLQKASMETKLEFHAEATTKMEQ
jgi:hypothetical protein